MATRIPAFLSIDVEPDCFQAPTDSGWRGYDFTVAPIEALRERLAQSSGTAPVFGWYFRMDPQIRALYGDVAFAVSAREAWVQQLTDRGDVFGVHVHPLRWSTATEMWVHDFGDPQWTTECVEQTVATFSTTFGETPLRYRHGAGLLTNDVVDVIDGFGFRVDLTLEPGDIWAHPRARLRTAFDTSPVLGSGVDCSLVPVEMYRPSPSDFRVRGRTDGRGLVIVPHTATRFFPEKPLWWRTARSLKTPAGRQRVRPLFAYRNWPSPRFYWDLVDKQLRSMDRPHLSLAIRTDLPRGAPMPQALALLHALPDHPLSRRLQFIDPVAVAGSVVVASSTATAFSAGCETRMPCCSASEAA